MEVKCRLTSVNARCVSISKRKMTGKGLTQWKMMLISPNPHPFAYPQSSNAK